MKLRLLGICRKTEFSPNHVENDLLIIMRTAEHLEKLGAEVRLIDEGDLGQVEINERLIFSMVQGPTGTGKLRDLAAERNPFIINTPNSVLNCYRVNMVTRLPQHGIPFPLSLVVNTKESLSPELKSQLRGKLWVKRGDVHAVHREDVVPVNDISEAEMILREFRKREIDTAILQKHIDGDTVKFYAVRESGFFHWYYLNGVYHTPFDRDQLHRLASRSAEALGLYVYGGDAIIERDGTITIIDINDWPSFAPVRDDASLEIAQLILRKAREYSHARDLEPENAN